jgi:arsenate reductase
MAEGLLRHMGGENYEAFSAGTRPAGLNPNGVKVMSEVGIDISGSRSKSVDEFQGQQFDYVVTVCDNAKESCPIFLGVGKRVHHSFRDPAAAAADEQVALFRQVRDEIQTWLSDFIATAERQ